MTADSSCRVACSMRSLIRFRAFQNMKMMPPGRYYELNGVPWPDDPECGSKKDKMKKMLEPNE